MRLTNDDRSAFVRAVIDDIPTVDYQSQVKDLIMKAAIDKLPPPVRRAYDTHKEYIETATVIIRLPLSSVYGVPFSHNGHIDIATNFPELVEKVDTIKEQAQAQRDKIQAIRAKVVAAIHSCTTLKRAKELLPEFEKYLPADRGNNTKQLPAVANLVAELMAAGWPKEKAEQHVKQHATRTAKKSKATS